MNSVVLVLMGWGRGKVDGEVESYRGQRMKERSDVQLVQCTVLSQVEFIRAEELPKKGEIDIVRIQNEPC
jgi:hypothetical protein